MTLLPIARRELVVASRRRSTFRVRQAAALLAIVVSFFMMVFAGLLGGSRQLGENLFAFLSWGSLVFCLFAGVFLTADALSEERREGTLGFLFLTDLGGFDIITGKLLIAGLNAFYGIVAILPVMAVAWLMGGVTGGEFWRMALVFVNTLFLSLAVGLWISTGARLQSESIARAFVAMMALALAPTIAGWAFGAGKLVALEWIRGFSPWQSFVRARDTAYHVAPGRFWASLGLAHSLAWLFLLRASFILPRRWREGEGPREHASVPTANGLAGTGAKPTQRRRFRRDLLDVNPVFALAMPGAMMRWAAWLSLLMGVPLLMATAGRGASLSLASPSFLLLPFEILLAWQASAFFAEARRTGAIELLLSTPLTDYEIIHGQMLALRRTFMRPALAIVIVMFVVPIGYWVLNISTAGGAEWELLLFGLLLAAWTAATLLLTMAALTWMGFWLALSDARPGLVFAKNVAFVSLLPAIVPCVPKVLTSLIFLGHARGRFRMPIRAILQGQRKPWRLR